MSSRTWQKSSYCAQGESCVHISRAPEAIHLTESSDPTHSILTTDPDAFAALLRVLNRNRT